jgi:BlaI family penicillinase repressor
VKRKRSSASAGVLTPLELEIMKVLWDFGHCTVADVQARLASDLAYNTVQTMLGVLVRKGRIVRKPTEGRAFLYNASVTRDRAMRTAVSDLVTRMFGGSGEALLLTLIKSRQITHEDIKRASQLLPKEEQK